MNRIEVKKIHGVPTIKGHFCTYDTKETRARIEAFSEANEIFILPSTFKVEFLPSEINGTVAKVSVF